MFFYRPFLGLGLLAVSASGLSSCVTAKRYEDLQARQQSEQEARTSAESQLRQAKADLQKTTDALAELRLDQKRLVADSTQTGNALRRTRTLYTQLTDSYDKLLKNSDRALADRNADYGRLAKDLATRESELGALDISLQKAKSDLSIREAKLAELTQALADKDKAVNDLKARVSNALLSFNSKDLQVKLKDGKVYVSLSEQLLFKSGSTKVDPKGQEALKKLATVLQEQKDVNVVVEGHTDNVPMRPTGSITDNWDLSALRATDIARLLTASGVEPSRITASGRSQYVPVAPNDTPQDKALNRRTEIILTPKLDELFQILDSNSGAPKP
ncbi:OmpA family protein [Hymenobacter baengnokdamensis]|uniref:OmpA family protein n=1 Tax=Hymenobacter baengnokdamensis TaxID=2615203 RepID=UPI001E5220EC|nr:OmpA family protein [Hymenobacter baengnokdamensis]